LALSIYTSGARGIWQFMAINRVNLSGMVEKLRNIWYFEFYVNFWCVLVEKVGVFVDKLKKMWFLLAKVVCKCILVFLLHKQEIGVFILAPLKRTVFL
jgi:hypothetical protein